MKIFMPFKQSRNSFLDEIEKKFSGEFIYGTYKQFDRYKEDIEVVHIHWPESIFSWNEPTRRALDEFKEIFLNWKEQKPVVYTRHNVYPHYRASTLFKELYDFIATHSDVVVHFGQFSLEEYVQRYGEVKDVQHEIVRHPLYVSMPNTVTQIEARRELNIPQDKKVVLVFGAIRNREEREFIFDVFNTLNLDSKHLLVSNMSPPAFRPFPRYVTTKLVWIYKWMNNLSSKKNIYYSPVGEDEVQNYMNAADVVLIPRMNLLNSGLFYLAMTFNKPVAAPRLGNLTEELRRCRMNGYTASDVGSACEELMSLLNNFCNQNDDMYDDIRATHLPKIVAQEYLKVYQALVAHE